MSGRVVYTCPFVPAEWIAAHGMIPSRMVPSGPKSMTEGVCPFAQAFPGVTQGADAVVVTTLCDQMRRISEVLECDAPTFLMNVPSTWETPTARGMYVSELERLGRFLVRLGGEPPSGEKLAETMRGYEAARTRLRDARRLMRPRDYSRALADFNRTGKMRIEPADTPPGVPLALVGGPLLEDDFLLFDLIEQSGGRVALDGTETGERGMPAPFDPWRLAEDPAGALAEAYFGSIPDASRRPNSMLYQWLRRMIEERGARGVILLRYVWCDNWHAEAQRMKEWLDMPLLNLDLTDLSASTARTITRLQAFMEMLRQ